MRPATFFLLPALLAGLSLVAAEPATDWKPLFDGKSLEGWASTDFYKAGEVKVADGAIRMEKGSERAGPMTGVTCTRKDLPKMDYEIRYKGRRVDGRDFFSTITFPVAESHCSLVTGGWGGTTIGLSSLDGVDASENDTNGNYDFVANKWHDFRIRVSKDRLEAWIDTKKVVNVVTTDRRIGIRIECYPSRPLGFSTYRTTGDVKDIAWRPLNAADLAEIAKLPKE